LSVTAKPRHLKAIWKAEEGAAPAAGCAPEGPLVATAAAAAAVATVAFSAASAASALLGSSSIPSSTQSALRSSFNLFTNASFSCRLIAATTAASGTPPVPCDALALSSAVAAVEEERKPFAISRLGERMIDLDFASATAVGFASIAAFDASAVGLLPSGVRWTYTYERASVLTAMREAAALHVQTLQVQGLYLSKAGHSIPVDFAAHWLLPHPFGRDSRSDPISSADEPAYRPQASLMRLKATDGYKPGSKLRDPDRKRMEEVKRYTKDMVFTDKMMS